MPIMPPQGLPHIFAQRIGLARYGKLRSVDFRQLAHSLQGLCDLSLSVNLIAFLEDFDGTLWRYVLSRKQSLAFGFGHPVKKLIYRTTHLTSDTSNSLIATLLRSEECFVQILSQGLNVIKRPRTL